MARQFEKSYRISENDDVLDKENKVHQDLDMRVDAIEKIAEEFRTGNRADVDALIIAINQDISAKSALIQALIDEADAGFVADRIIETALKRFTSDAEQQAHIDALEAEKVRINARATSAALGAHTGATNNPHGVTAAQIGTLTTDQIDEDLEILEAALKGGVDPGLDTLAKLAAALAKRPRVDAAQSFDGAEKGRARANIDAGLLAGFRNKIINPDFSIWQRGVTLAAAAGERFLADRWVTSGTGSTIAPSRQSFPSGTPPRGNPLYYHRSVVASVAGAGNSALQKHRIEDVSTFAGKRATLTFDARADAAKPIAVEFVQSFGTGGSPSAAVTSIGVTKLNLTTTMQRYDVVVDIPSIVGKTLGTNRDHRLEVNIFFDAGSSLNARTGSLGQQSGTFDISLVSLVEGDATAESDPSSLRHPQQELALCARYFQSTFNDGVPPSAGVTQSARCVQNAASPGTTLLLYCPLAITLRSTPTVTLYAPNTGNSGKGTQGNGSTSIDVTATADNTGPKGFRVYATMSSGYFDLTFHYWADAEL